MLMCALTMFACATVYGTPEIARKSLSESGSGVSTILKSYGKSALDTVPRTSQSFMRRSLNGEDEIVRSWLRPLVPGIVVILRRAVHKLRLGEMLIQKGRGKFLVLLTGKTVNEG